MAERCNLLIGRIIATRTSDIGIPTRLRAGGGLCFVLYQIMAERRDFLICRVITFRAGFIRFPAGFRTGSRLPLVIYESMYMLHRFADAAFDLDAGKVLAHDDDVV